MASPATPHRIAATAKNLSRALLSACPHQTTLQWTPIHEQTLYRFLPPTSTLTPALLSSTIDPHLLAHHHLALGLFNWATQKSTFYHTPQTYNSLLKSLSLSRHSGSSIQSVLHQARTQRVILPPSSYHMAISSLVSCGKTLEAAKFLFSDLPTLDSGVSMAKICNSLLAALADEGHWVYAQKLFEEMRKRGIPFSDIGFGVFIGGYVRIVELDRILGLVDQIRRRENCEINGSIVALLVVDGLCRVGRGEEAWRALEEMRMRGWKPDFIAYRIVSESFISTCRLEDSALILKQKRKFGVSPRTNDYKDFIFALIGERRTSVANELSKAIVDGDFTIEDDVLNALISSVSAIDSDSAVFFCKYMLKNGRLPSFVSLNDLSGNLCKREKSDEMWDIFKILLTKDYFRGLLDYNMILSFLCKEGRVREAYSVLKEMKKKGVNPDVSSYNLLMEACCREDLIRPAKKLWDEMFANNCSGNLQTYNILIQKFQDLDDAEESLRLFDHMIQKGVLPDSITYSSVVKVLFKANRVDDAHQIFNKSVVQDSKLATSVLSHVVLSLCKEGKFFAASRFLCSIPFVLDSANPHVIVLKSLSDAGHIDKAVEHIEWIRDNSPHHLQTTLNYLMSSLSTAPKMDNLLRLLQIMSKRGILSVPGPWTSMPDVSLSVH